MARTRKRALYVAEETGGYSVDPSADGSGYLPVQVFGAIGDLADELEMLETNYQTGENFQTAMEPGGDGWSFNVEVPILGLSTAQTGVFSLAEDFLDLFLKHIFSAGATVDGAAVTSATASTIQIGSDTHNEQDLIFVHDTAILSSGQRGQWRSVRVDNGAGSYDIAHDWTANPTATGQSYGVRRYLPSDEGGNSLAFVYVQDDLIYTLTGGRVTAASINAPARQLARLVMTISGDAKGEDSAAKTALPLIDTFTRSPTKGLLCEVVRGTADIAVSDVSIDLGVTAAPTLSCGGAQGRGDFPSLAINPVVTLAPEFADSFVDTKRSGAEDRLLITFGSGNPSGGSVVNTAALHIEASQIQAANPADDGGLQRQSLELRANDAGLFDATTRADVFSFARA